MMIKTLKEDHGPETDVMSVEFGFELPARLYAFELRVLVREVRIVQEHGNRPASHVDLVTNACKRLIREHGVAVVDKFSAGCLAA